MTILFYITSIRRQVSKKDAFINKKY